MKKKYRRFRDSMGFVHVVEVSEEEMLARWQYAAGFIGTCLFFAAALTAASGILG